ncbi:MAG: glycosyltransferase [Pseudomonadota bacterium]|nr:glycosyltransferase [Pseudomonadota bacterium]
MKVALLITAFNRPDALNLVLETVACQSRLPDEVVVCDDGSFFETRMLVRQWEGMLPIRHTWQPNSDFRAARSRNLGVCKSATEYLVWIDGDCLLPAQFLENHLQLAQRGYLVAGGRYLLSDIETQRLLAGSLPISSVFSHWKFRFSSLGILRDLRAGAWETVRTCNVGLHLDDLEAIGGFDESYVGWGREDSDFVVRVIHNGVRVRSGRLAACVAHLHHPERARDQLSENDARFYSCLNDPTQIYPKSSILTQP